MEYELSHKIEVMFSEEEIQARIKEMAQQISKDYAGKSLRIIGVLKGGVFFMTELTKYITIPLTFDFVAASSYGSATKSSGNVVIEKDLTESIEGQDVLIVEDIIDTGRTLSNLVELFKDRKAASVRLCTLLDKPSRRVADLDSDYSGFVIPDAFVVGCGMDYGQMYRNLPYIGVVGLQED